MMRSCTLRLLLSAFVLSASATLHGDPQQSKPQQGDDIASRMIAEALKSCAKAPPPTGTPAATRLKEKPGPLAGLTPTPYVSFGSAFAVTLPSGFPRFNEEPGPPGTSVYVSITPRGELRIHTRRLEGTLATRPVEDRFAGSFTEMAKVASVI